MKTLRNYPVLCLIATLLTNVHFVLIGLAYADLFNWEIIDIPFWHYFPIVNGALLICSIIAHSFKQLDSSLEKKGYHVGIRLTTVTQVNRIAILEDQLDRERLNLGAFQEAYPWKQESKNMEDIKLEIDPV